MELIFKEALEQMHEEGRPLSQYILTPSQWDSLVSEAREFRFYGQKPDTETKEITLTCQTGPIRIIKGPP